MTNTSNAQKWSKLALITFGFLLLGAGLLAYFLTVHAFPSNGNITKPISVTVYVEKTPAQLLIKSFIYNTDPAADSVEVSVIGPKDTRDPSLLVVQCPNESPYLRAHQKNLIIEPSHHSKPLEAIVKPYMERTWQSYLDCYAPPTSSASTPAASAPSGQAINIAAPVLEANPAAQLVPGFAPLYAEERSGRIVDAVEVAEAPGVSCPRPAPTASPSAVPSPASGATASPSPSPAAFDCYTAVAGNTKSTEYVIPNSATNQVTTVETLEGISLSGDQIESMIPDGHILSNNQVYWQGGADLSPSLSAANLSSERTDGVFIFAAGIAIGLFASVALTIVQEVLPLKR